MWTITVPLDGGRYTLRMSVTASGVFTIDWPRARPKGLPFSVEDQAAYIEAREYLFEALARHHGLREDAERPSVKATRPAVEASMAAPPPERKRKVPEITQEERERRAARMRELRAAHPRPPRHPRAYVFVGKPAPLPPGLRMVKGAPVTA